MPLKLLTTREAAAILEVSDATIYNWVRCKLLFPNSENPLRFTAASLHALQKKITDGNLPRLRKRANRRCATGQYDARQVELLLFESVKHFLQQRHEITSDGYTYRRSTIAVIMDQWHKRLPLPDREFIPAIEFKKVLQPGSTLSPGVLYESLTSTGNRSAAGSYYTPPAIADALLKKMPQTGSLLDPSCGSGRFLTAAARQGRKFEELFGVDIDPLAVTLARIALLLEFPDMDQMPQIRQADALLDFPFPAKRFDVVAGNPPWGRVSDDRYQARLRQAYPQLKSREYFTFFLHQALRLAKPGGTLGMILPESLLHIRRHRKFCTQLFERLNLESIEELGQPFRQVCSRAITLTARVETSPHPQKRFPALHEALVAKILAMPHDTLHGHARWALGIVSGDNRKYLKPYGSPDTEAIWRGCEIQPYEFLKPQHSISLTPNLPFQQMAPLELYRHSPKLVYRFISRRLVCALDRQGKLTLNSANLLLVDDDFAAPEIIAALFNSQLWQFLFQCHYRTCRVLRKDLEELPIPYFTQEQRSELIELVHACEKGDKKSSRIDRLLFDCFNLTEQEQNLIASTVHPVPAPKSRKPDSPAQLTAN